MREMSDEKRRRRSKPRREGASGHSARRLSGSSVLKHSSGWSAEEKVQIPGVQRRSKSEAYSELCRRDTLNSSPESEQLPQLLSVF